jgi:cytochrome c553
VNGKRSKGLYIGAADAFSYVAIWQAAVFLVLILLVWFNEVVDVAAVVMGSPSSPPDPGRGCLASAGVLLAAIVTIGHTYVQQKSLVSGMLTVCCYCHKIKLNQAVWQRVEEYVGRHSLTLFSHGICPECFEKATVTEVGPTPPSAGAPPAP